MISLFCGFPESATLHGGLEKAVAEGGAWERLSRCLSAKVTLTAAPTRRRAHSGLNRRVHSMGKNLPSKSTKKGKRASEQMSAADRFERSKQGIASK